MNNGAVCKQADLGPRSPRRKSSRPPLALGGPNSPTARSANNGSTDYLQSKERTSTLSMPSSVAAAAAISTNKGSQEPLRQVSSVKRPDSFQA